MASRSGWIKRRARRIEGAFESVPRRMAVFSAREDWQAFRGAVRADREAGRSCDTLGVCQLHATGCQRCTACPFQHVPRSEPPFALRPQPSPRLARKTWRAVLRIFCRSVVERTPW